MWVFFGNSRMQIRKKWLNQLKNFFNKHFKEYYLASFCWWIPSSCENHCTLVYTYQGTIVPSLSTGGLVCTRWTKQRVGGKCLQLGQMRQVDWAAAEHLLSPFSSPYFRVKWLYDYGFWSGKVKKNPWVRSFSRPE
jgi:hypothetical protein